MIALVFWLEFWRVLLQPPRVRQMPPRAPARVVNLADWRRNHPRSHKGAA